MRTIQGNKTGFVNLDETFGAQSRGGLPRGLSADGAVTALAIPTLSIDDVTQSEGTGGTTIFRFTVSLSAPAGPGGVTFDISTSDGTAQDGNPVAEDADYVARSLTGQVIPAGATIYTFDITVNGDSTVEPNQSFFVNVTNVAGASVADSQGLGTITNDDFPPPSLSISDVTQREGNAGTTTFQFTVTRSGGTGAITVDYSTSAGTATAGSDFIATSGTISFAAGENSKTITVSVNGDTLHESDETFDVILSNPTGNAVIADAVGLGTIIDDELLGDSGNNTLTGTPNADLFRLEQGGDDTAYGLGGNDGFYFGAALSAGDFVDGGAGNDDQVGLQGNYSGLVINAANFVGIETFALLGGDVTTFGGPGTNFYDYNITTTGSFGRNVIVNGNGLRVGEDFTFNGSAEASGSFTFYGGSGVETLTGGAGSDGFYFGPGRWGASDSVNGGGGSDNQLGLRGDFTITFGTGQLTNIQTIALLSDMDPNFTQIGDGEFDYAIVLSDGNVAAGQQLTVTGAGLGATETMQVNGSAETNGTLRLIGGAGNDLLTGGGGADAIFGGLRGDTLTGNGGNDSFIYTDVSQSNSTERDGIQDFTLGDTVNLSGIDANIFAAGDQAFSFIGNAAFSGSGAASAGQLRYENISLGGPIWLVAGDTNGDGVSDFEIVLVISDVDPITAADFWL